MNTTAPESATDSNMTDLARTDKRALSIENNNMLNFNISAGDSKEKLSSLEQNDSSSKTSTRNRSSPIQRKTKSRTAEVVGSREGSKSKSKAHLGSDSRPMEESETIRKWFTNLPSGAARSSAAAINDEKFIKYYLELCKQFQQTVSRDHFSDENGDAVINAIILGEDSGYCKETWVESKPLYPCKTPEFILSNKDNSIVYGARSSSTDKSQCNSNGSTKMRVKENETVTSLHFDSGNDVTITNKKSRVTNSRVQGINVVNNQTYKAEITDKEVSAEASCIIEETTFTLPKVKDARKRDIVAAKIQASKALASRVNAKIEEVEDKHEHNKTFKVQQKNQNSWLAIQSLELLHHHSRVVSTKMTEHLEGLFKSMKKEKALDKMPLDILCFDPEFLSVQNGEKLYNLADCIIRYYSRQPFSGFLTTSPSDKYYKDIVLKGKWPSWMLSCITKIPSSAHKTSMSVPFDIVLLAKIEIAIMRSHHNQVKGEELDDIEKKQCTSKEKSIESKLVSKGELSAIIRLAKKIRQNGEKLGVERCQLFLSSSLLLLHESESDTIKRPDPSTREKSFEGFILENILLVPIPLLQSFILNRMEFVNGMTFAGAIESTLKQFHSIAVEANNLASLEASSNAQNNQHGNSSSNGQSNSKLSKNRKKNKKKKKKKKNSSSSSNDKPTAPINTADTKNSSTESKPANEVVDKSRAVKDKSKSSKIETSVKTEENDEKKKSSLSKKASSVDVTVVNGSSAVVVEQLNPNTSESHSDENWSKVESKNRSNRARSAQKQMSDHSTNASGSQTKSGKTKSGRSSASRKRVAHRRIVKDILASIFQGVDEEISRRRKLEIRAFHEERRRREEQKKAVTATSSERPTSLRDVLIGNGAASIASKKLSVGSKIASLSSSIPNKIRESSEKESNIQCTKISRSSRRQHKHHNADQNTAPTLSETLSGVSVTSNSHISAGSIEDQQQETVSNDSSDERPIKKNSVSPPLPTLLSGVRNNHSASSSVASSLEAHGLGEQNANEKESDVGYHLLSFCARLSTDMTTFMGRRRCALDLRRRERGALLGALQEIAAKMFVGRCHAEMYGSCATQLDLPSSDLDVVICGLPPTKQQRKKKHGDMLDGMDQYPYHGFQSINGSRVLRLAGELERQPWVVQIKPIPTASVPVIKMLADPARLVGIGHDIGMNGNGEWLMQTPNSSQAMLQHNYIPNTKGAKPSSTTTAHPVPLMKPFPIPWRGADVMNGLMSIDITFEGPEHGGLGSTAYSTQVVQDACNETGLAPESTPAVQAIMVLKELLAQRRLNDPFLGGLSSYALLLMVVAIIRERKAIRAEMDLAEKQRKAVSAPALNTKPVSGTPKESSSSSVEHKLNDKSIQKHAAGGTQSSSSSWASIAKHNQSNGTNTDVDTDGDGDGDVDESNTTKTNKKLDASIITGISDYGGQSQEQSFNFAQGSDDVLEVLCSGEPTAGKLLMHFLLFYGHYFDSQSMVIDITAEGGRGPFAPRASGGCIDPITGMFTVDPIVVYDPLDGEERRNVARSCYAWQNIRCVFAQCYTTLQHTVERKGRSSGSDTSTLLELLLSF